jgi:hypothetical protein
MLGIHARRDETVRNVFIADGCFRLQLSQRDRDGRLSAMKSAHRYGPTELLPNCDGRRSASIPIPELTGKLQYGTQLYGPTKKCRGMSHWHVKVKRRPFLDHFPLRGLLPERLCRTFSTHRIRLGTMSVFTTRPALAPTPFYIAWLDPTIILWRRGNCEGLSSPFMPCI